MDTFIPIIIPSIYILSGVVLLILSAGRKFPGKPWFIAFLSIGLITSIVQNVLHQILFRFGILDYEVMSKPLFIVFNFVMVIAGLAGYFMLFPFLFAVAARSQTAGPPSESSVSNKESDLREAGRVVAESGAKNVVQAHRVGSFPSTLSPVTKVFGISTPAFLLLLLIGSEVEWLMPVGLIGFVVSLLVWVVLGTVADVRSRGAKNAAAWGFWIIPAVLLSPIGLIIFWTIKRSKLGDERRGFCPSCNRRIGFEIKACPFCGCVFLMVEPATGQHFTEISAEDYAGAHNRTVEEVVADIKCGRLMGIKKGDFWYVDGRGRS
jgi:hypothetical protein